ALLAALLAYIGAAHPSLRLVWAGGITASLLLAASIVAAIAGASRDFMGAGAVPKNLRNWAKTTYADERRWATEAELLDALGKQLDEAITKNATLLRCEGLLVNVSLGVALVSLLLGLAAYWAVPIFTNG
ncbi:MAG: hypothetical protein ACP5P4_15815, partial [Steroidobacteraceae bacterium]